jgi:glycosyltransferase involved in cell wall biosynthesis
MQRPVKLAYVTTVPVTQWGFLRGQNAYFSGKGFEIHAISSPGRHLDALAERDGVTAHAVPIARTISPLGDVLTAWRLFRLFRRIRPDIAHVSTPKAALLGAAAAWAARVPVRVFCIRGSATEPASGLQRHIYRIAEWLTGRFCHQAICVSESLLAFVRSESILARDRGMVAAKGMSNGVDVQRFDVESIDPARLRMMPGALPRLAQDPSAVVVGYVGRLTLDKGIEILWRAWMVLRQEYDNLHLVLVGPWEKEASVAGECRRSLETDARVHIVGYTEDVVPYYRLMSFCVFPSFGSEGFPNAPMEAAAMRLPVVATRVVGAVDAVEDGVTGILVPPRNVEALIRAMRMYVEDPGLRQRHGAAGCARVRRDFGQEAIWAALEEEYARLLQGAGLVLRGGDSRVAGRPLDRRVAPEGEGA